MSALDTLERIVENENLFNYPFRYCLVGADKIPYSLSGSRARPNEASDFCSLDELSLCPNLDKYAGLGVSIIESKICAIDVDKCFKEPFNIESADERAKDIIEMFKDLAYIEFSFSGRGLRILFVAENIPDYETTFYIKNAKTHIEYYQPKGHARYVTLTGQLIYNNSFYKMRDLTTLTNFLMKYMQRPKSSPKTMPTCDLTGNNALSVDELLKKVKSLYLTNIEFQDLWWGQAPGSNSNESEKDFHLLKMLFDYIVEDKEKLRQVFERSPYFASKDQKHNAKWFYGNYRYYEYMYSHL